ncbi:CD109 antigen-like protein, partial [Leptotrombidium deliense]
MQAKPYINIDDKVTEESLNFLSNSQNEDGSFRENGYVLQKEMQSMSGDNSASLAAYIFIALNTNSKLDESVKEMLKKTEEYLIKHMHNTNDTYEISIITYALHLHNSTFKNTAFEKMKNCAKTNTRYTYWTKGDNSDVASVEMTSYGLMTMMLRKDITSALPALRYL